MASFLSHPCFPSTSLFLTTEGFSSTLHSPSQQPFLALPLSKCPSSSLSHALKSKSSRSSPSSALLFRFSCVSSATSTAVATERELDAEDRGVDELQQEGTEEFSRIRLLAQNIPWACTAEDVRSLFEKHGRVVDVELLMHDKTRNRGLAFVEMGSPEEALAALNGLESSEFEGRTLRINYAKLKKKKPLPAAANRPIPTFNLFVANLSYEARAKDLREFFGAENSSVASAEVIFHDNPRRSSGYGFVSFKSKKEAEAALTSFQGKVLLGRPIRVAQSKQFVKVQTEESLQPKDATTELITDSERVDTAEQN